MCPHVAGALGPEGVHRGGIPAREGQKCCGHYARGSGGAHHSSTPTKASSGLQPLIALQMVHPHQGEITISLIFRSFVSCLFCNVFECLCLQGRIDALLALLRRQYDRVAIMRPTPQDKARNISSIITKAYEKHGYQFSMLSYKKKSHYIQLDCHQSEFCQKYSTIKLVRSVIHPLDPPVI